VADHSRALAVRTEGTTLDFHGDGITVLRNEDGVWLVLGQLTTNLGLDARSQQRAIEHAAWSKGKTVVTTLMLPGEARPYPRFLIHQRILPMWLANITTSRIPDADTRAKVETYQVELADVLADHVERPKGLHTVSTLPDLPKSYADALRELAATVEAKERAEAAVAELEPAAQAWDTLASTGQDYSAREAAYILNRDGSIKTGQNLLLREIRRLKMVDPFDRPYAEHKTHLTLKPQSYSDQEGNEYEARPQLRITYAGLKYLHKKLGGSGQLRLEVGEAR
jgi:P22_AR N-terminal domain/Phage antirepressor protein KilAC domain